MTNGELIKKLFKSYKKRDHEAFHAAAMQIVAEEQKKNHNILARDLQRILENGDGRTVNGMGLREFEELPRDREKESLLLEVRSPDRYWDDIVVDDHTRQQVEIALQEYRYSSILQTYGLSPRLKLLFYGPPGCGKTICAEVIAGELGLPLLYVRFDAVISSYLGETASNLRRIFDYATRGQWVLFFDEFDAVGKSRSDSSEHGELKRVINTFLQLLDGFQSDSLLIAATNHEGMLDRALWRRFDDIVRFDKPNTGQIYHLVQLKLRGFRHKNLDVQKFTSEMQGWSHADVERVCIEAMKISILSDLDKIDDFIFNQALKRQQQRMEYIKSAMD